MLCLSVRQLNKDCVRTSCVYVCVCVCVCACVCVGLVVRMSRDFLWLGCLLAIEPSESGMGSFV